MRGVEDQCPVEEFAAYAADPAFHDGVHARCLSNGAYDPDAFGTEHLIEQRSELTVPVTNQELEVTCPVTQLWHQVPGLLGDSAGGRIRSDAHDVHPAGGVFDDREAVQPSEGDRLGME